MVRIVPELAEQLVILHCSVLDLIRYEVRQRMESPHFVAVFATKSISDIIWRHFPQRGRRRKAANRGGRLL